MLFGKWLQQQKRESLPGWRDKFFMYKELKKLVKLIACHPSDHAAAAEFLRLLHSEIDKFNKFFRDKEERYVIHQQELRERVRMMAGAADGRWSNPVYREEMRKIKRDVVNFHGEMVLLVNYSCVNYTGLAKILKKYEKKTGRLLRRSFIQRVLNQPFFTIDIITSLLQECENMNMVFPIDEEEGISAVVEAGEEPSEVEEESTILRNTVAALVIMRDMRSESSTTGPHSLPPVTLPDNDVFQSFRPHPPC